MNKINSFNTKFLLKQHNLAVLAVLLIGILLRFFYLDADPHYYAWVGYISDEGRWNESARNLIQGRSMFIQDTSLHLLLAPLFQFTNYIFYLLFDMSRLTSRLFPALCGSTILLLFYFNFRKLVTPQALLFGVALMALQPDLVNLSRISIPEIAVMLFELLIYLLIISRKYLPFNFILAGFLMFIAIGIKATVLPFLAIFSLIILFIPATPVNGDISTRRRNLLLFWGGFGLPAFLTGVVVVFCCIYQVPTLFNVVSLINKFLRIISLHDLIKFPFEDSFSTTFNIWSLGLWITLLTWIALKENKRDIDFENKRVFVSALIWFVFYFVMMVVLDYFPARYKAHILIPMSIIIMQGISIIQKEGISNIIDLFSKGKILIQLLKTSIMVFPVSVMFAPLLGYVFSTFLTDPEKLRYKFIFITIMMFLFSTIGFIFRSNKKVVCYFLIFPFIGTVFWQILSVSSAVGYPFWISAEAGHEAAVWTLILLGSSAASIVIGSAVNQWNSIIWGRVINAASLFYLIIALIRISPTYLNPQYTIKNTSIQLGKLLENEPFVDSYNAAGLFIDNSISYRWYNRMRPNTDMPRIIVKAQAFVFLVNKEYIDKYYHPIKKYKVYISQEPSFYYSSPSDEVVVYERNDPD